MIHLIRNLLLFTITCNVALSMEDHEPKVRKKGYPSFFKAHKKKLSAIPRPLKESIQEERDYESYLAALSETQVTASETLWPQDYKKTKSQENKELNNETELQRVEKLIEHIQEAERLQHVERLLQQAERLLQQAERSQQRAKRLQQRAERLQQQAEYVQQAKDFQLTTSSLNLAEREIYSLPKETHIMKKLENYSYIDLSHNNIEKLPKAICEWNSLISLDLSHNKIKTAPWQVFTIGAQRSQPGSLTIIFCNNPIEIIPNDFFKAMISQKTTRKGYQGISLEFDQDVIEQHILPALETEDDLKTYLVESSCGKIRNGFCKIQNQKGEFLSFDSKQNPIFSWVQGMS